ncbi:MAG: hypothetical protein F6K47_44270 [Symploca sp. SIO2E6]|nr:hypothetical protein [Symploca sp. SIO2E6]
MNINTINEYRTRSLQSTLWVFFFLQVIFKDLHDFFRVGMIEEILSGVVNGNKVSEEMLLVGGIMLQLPLLMIVFTKVLPRQAVRVLTFIVAPLALLASLSMGYKDMDDALFYVVWTITLMTVVVMAARWKEASPLD